MNSNFRDSLTLEVFAERTAVVFENIILYNIIREHAEYLEKRVPQRTVELCTTLATRTRIERTQIPIVDRVSR